jgi:hypothetical protein
MQIAIAILAILLMLGYLSNRADAKKRKAWLDYLHNKYKDADVVDGIIGHRIWIGQTSEMLEDSMGKPSSIDEKIYKTKTKDTWKYRNTGKGRYALRITLENDIVVGWDDKR